MKNSLRFLIVIFGTALVLAGCATAKAGTAPPAASPAPATLAASETAAPVSPSATPVPPTSTAVPSATPVPSTATPSGPTATATRDTRPDPARWSDWPVIPTLSAAAKAIFQKGLDLGNDPHIYSTIGDCQSEPDVFLGIYATNRYWLGSDYTYLQATVDFFKNSFAVQSLAVRDGLNPASALDPLWAYKNQCNANEGPVACDLRVHKPSIVFINLGTNWLPGASITSYEKYLRQIVDKVIASGALPVLATKADDVEGGNLINRATAQVAHDYDIPLWNMWRTVQDLANRGLDSSREDIYHRTNVYLTVEAWDRRSFSALTVLDHLRTELRPLYDPSAKQ